MYRTLLALVLALTISVADAAGLLDTQAVESAAFTEKLPSKEVESPLTVKVEVLLDRAHFSPGEIDGKLGENVEKAITAYSEAHGLTADFRADAASGPGHQYALARQKALKLRGIEIDGRPA